MVTTIFGRMTGRMLKDFGWWQFLVLSGVCAWLSTPVDAQQNTYQPLGTAPLDGGFNQDDGDTFLQSGGFGRNRTPARGRWGDQAGQFPRQMQPIAPLRDGGAMEQIDLRPNGQGEWGIGGDDGPRTSRYRAPVNNEDPLFVSPRHRRPATSAPAFQGPAFPGAGSRGPAPQVPALPDSSYQMPGVQEPAYRSPGFQSPMNQAPAFQSPGYQGHGNGGGGFQGPVYQNPQPRQLPQEQVVSPAQDAQARITRRYQNQGFLSLLSLPPQQSVALYSEVTQMINTRHLEPTTPRVRVQKAMGNLIFALDVPAFVQTNQLMLQPGNVQAYRQALQQAMQAPVQSEQDALNMLNWTMQVSQQQIGLRPAATALEFVYGAVESLDKYSAFVPPERTPGASLQLESKLVGIGVQIEMKPQGAEVSKVISGSPAQSAGLKDGDVLLAVSGQELAGVSVDQAVELISGPAGSPVVLGVQRQAQGPFTVTVTRQPIQLHSVNDIQLLSGTRVGYFKLDKFTGTATEEVENAMQQLYQQGMDSVVIDLRGNPGGLLTAAIQISDKFLPQGTIVATRGRTPADNTEELATKEHTWKLPLVVLVDHNSASASEIFAAAIQENQRGVVVGRTSYGKGTVQTQFPLQTAGCSLRITTARFYSPTGRVMAGSGVTPDIQVPESAGSPAFGIMDQDVLAALNVAQRGVMQGNPNLSGIPNFSRTQIPQPFAQPQYLPAGR